MEQIKTNNKTISNDQGSIVALCAIFIYNPLIVIGAVFINKFVPFFRKFDIFSYLFVLILIYFWAIFLKKIKISKDMIIVPISMFLLFGISFAFFPQNRPYLIMPLYYLISQILPAYFFTRAIHRVEILITYLTRISYFIIFFSVLSLVVQASQTNYLEYSMVFAYVILPSVLISLSALLNKFNTFNLIFSFLGVFAIITNGSRGSLLTVIVYLVLYSIINIKKKISIVLISFSILSSLFVFSDNFYNNLEKFSTFLENYNIKSRTISKILIDEVAWDNGRMRYFDSSIEIANENPILGLGMAGDRLEGANKLRTTHISYSHNLFIELLAQYGFFIGGTLILTLLLVSFYGIFINRNKSLKLFILAFAPLVFVKLMLSSTYLAEIHFFM
ncbi:MAG: hypothetical protein GQ534_09220, partial [Candidatus Delongbacteria bacterium]|nr:hypothetical protein [Candidatus Delongbacteria bacterium]